MKVAHIKDYKVAIKHDGKLQIATGRSRKDTVWKNEEILWSQLVTKLRKTHRTVESYSEYQRMSKEKQDSIKDIGGFVGGTLKDGKRNTGSVITRQLLTLDADFAPKNLWDDIQMFFDFSCCMYSTHNHNPDKPRLRILIPLSRPVLPDEYEAIARKVAEDIGIDYFDDTTYQPSRLMYWPSTSQDGEYLFEYQDGVWLNADTVLERYEDWKDTSFWPESSRSQKRRKRLADKQGDPTEKEGLIGAFCRTYTVPDVIDLFLSDIYTQCSIPNRYTYTGGSTSAGLVIYGDGKFAYSNHSTDPAGGKLCNAFDLVRIHKFGELDEAATADTPINNTPSYQEMMTFIQNDDQTKLTIGEERLEIAKAAFDDEEAENLDEWLLKLETNKKGEYQNTIDNIKIILLNDPNLKGKTGYNEFNFKPAVLGDLPWRKKGNNDVWSDSDDSGLRHYIEHVYHITGVQKVSDALAIVQEMNKFHPVRDYLDTLEWDGVQRLDTLFIDYLGAIDEEYTRVVTRKAFTAAVARIYHPGIKFDTMTVLTGPQGLGKSTLLKLMGKDWYSDSFTTVVGKEAYEQLHGCWLVEMAELSATKKAEVEAVKHFISKQEDNYRQAYGRRVGTYKRQCVFFGTTNDFEFLKDRTGNRRFWPVATRVQTPTKDVFKELKPEVVDQLWAEAKHRYKEKEQLFLTKDLEKIAFQKQEEHSEYNSKLGLIRDYLEMKLPDNWDGMDIGSRRAYIHGTGFGELKRGTVIRDRVCTLEIWCELLEGETRTLGQIQAREINDMLNRMEGWIKHPSTMRFGDLYGIQRGYIRE